MSDNDTNLPTVPMPAADGPTIDFNALARMRGATMSIPVAATAVAPTPELPAFRSKATKPLKTAAAAAAADDDNDDDADEPDDDADDSAKPKSKTPKAKSKSADPLTAHTHVHTHRGDDNSYYSGYSHEHAHNHDETQMEYHDSGKAHQHGHMATKEFDPTVPAQPSAVGDGNADAEREKAGASTEGKKNDNPGPYAYTDSEGGTHLPIGDEAHVRNALSRFDETDFESDAKKKSARAKVEAAAKKFGIDSSSAKKKEFYDPAAIKPVSTTAAAASTHADAATPKGLLAAIKSWATHPALKETAATGAGTVRAPLRLVKDSDGRTRFFATFSAAVEDNQGETILTAAHKDYVEWADTEQVYPELWMWHIKGTKYGQADMVDYADGFMVASGLIDEGYEPLAESIAKEDTGLSHGFLCAVNSSKEITKYRTYEISTLPRANASVPWTGINLLESNDVALTQAKKDYLKTHGVSDEAIAEFESNVGTLASTLKEAGVKFKEAEGSTAASTDGDVVALTKAVSELAGIVVKDHEVLVGMSKSDDEKFEERFKAAVTKVGGFSAASDDKTKADEAKLKEVMAGTPSGDAPKREDASWFANLALGSLNGVGVTTQGNGTAK